MSTRPLPTLENTGLGAFAPEAASHHTLGESDPVLEPVSHHTLSESNQVLEPVARHTPSASNQILEPVSIATLLESNQICEWYEAVAIVQELCRTLADGRARVGAGALAAANVTIDTSGRVGTLGRVQDDPAGVHQVAELLRAMLPNEVPVPLRLALSQSLASPPLYSSLTEFSRALEYFERPNRNVIIETVYRRWEQQEPRRPQSVEQEKSHTQDIAEPQKPARAGTTLARYAVLVACGVGVVLALAITAALIVTNVINVGGQTATDPLRSAGAAAVHAASSVATNIINRIYPPRASDAPEITKPGEPVPAQRPRARVPSSVTPSLPTSFSRVVGIRDPARSRSADVADIRRQTVDNLALSGTPAGSDSAMTTAIYSAVDIGVDPPVAIYPQFPSAMFGPPPQDAATFDVVIDHFGSVESVKQRQAPNSIGNAMVMTMSLSAAKTWRFRPASKDGQPVKYRQTIWLPSTP